MYAIELKDLPPFRTHIEDMNYCAVPSRFPLHTAYIEVIIGIDWIEFYLTYYQNLNKIIIKINWYGQIDYS